jgi:quinone-modifying oxidoreductase subunit QmoB
MAETKTAAYICKGCEIGTRLDTDALVKTATKSGKMNLVREHDFLCSAEGVAMIKNDIENEGVTHAALCACSRRAKTEAFNFPTIAMSRGNLREGVIWIRPDTDEARETTQEMAEDYVRMACAEVKAMTVPPGNQKTGSVKTLLVVGGGMSGMTSALEASKAGYKVVLVEKSGALGGWAAKLHKRVPTREPFKAPEDNGVADMAARIEADSNIKVYLNATIAKTDGAPGRFKVEIAIESGAIAQEDIGAIIQATGFHACTTPTSCPSLLTARPQTWSIRPVWKRWPRKLPPPASRSAVRATVSRSSPWCSCSAPVSVTPTGTHLQYCSGFCCNTSIKQATYFKDSNPDIDTVVLFTDLRTPGNGEDFYRSAQNKGVIFSKGVVSQVTPNGNTCTVKFKDLILNEDTEAQADLVVLATGMVPVSGVNIDAPVAAPAEAEAAVEGEAPKEVVATIAPESILNLTYRQGPDMPQFKHGFTDSHFICFPYETRRTGIYTAGPVRRPMDILQAQEDATGAAMKAIQAMENAGLGKAAHPRAGDLSFPTVRLEGCTQCKRCTVECPFGAIDEDEKRFPLFNESPLPPLRYLYGRLPGARDLVRELLGQHRRRPDQGR